jgi:L-2-hydroxyglutarate oxidase LhgO
LGSVPPGLIGVDHARLGRDDRQRAVYRSAGERGTAVVVQGPEAHGIPGLVNLYGIESPGLTSSLPLADEIVRQLGG